MKMITRLLDWLLEPWDDVESGEDGYDDALRRRTIERRELPDGEIRIWVVEKRPVRLRRFAWIVLLAALILIAWLAHAAHAAEGWATYYTVASCQREGTSGVYTANGERYDEEALTCAIRGREWGAMYLVTNVETGAEVYVRHNDFGPGKGPSARGVIIDLTPAAFRALGAELRLGKIRVAVQRVQD